ncbi:MAG: hypothetical protein AAFP26_02425 [Planctomycetota bacterium]
MADGINPNSPGDNSASDSIESWCSAGNTQECPCEGSRGATLRAAADGELSPAQAERLAGELREGDRERIAFERELRGACGQAMGGGMGGVTCPDELQAKIRAMAAERRAELGGASSVIADARDAGRLDELGDAIAGQAPATRSRSFWSGQRAFQAMAAALVMGVVGVFLWQATGVAFTPTQGAVTVQQTSARDELVQHFASEHRQQLAGQVGGQVGGTTEARAQTLEIKLAFESQAEAEAALSARVGDAVRLPECPLGTIKLRGAGPCQVPAADGTASARSGHALFNISRDGREVAVSLFVSPARADLGLEEGVVYKLKTEPCGQAGTRVLCWLEGEVAYYLVQQIDEGEGCDRVLETMGLGSPSFEI